MLQQTKIKSLQSHTIKMPIILKPKEEIPWFPKKLSDLDRLAHRVLSYGAELDADHPGFTDPIYRERRLKCADIAHHHKYGRPIPKVRFERHSAKRVHTIRFSNDANCS